jgi:hypothetical protein
MQIVLGNSLGHAISAAFDLLHRFGIAHRLFNRINTQGNCPNLVSQRPGDAVFSPGNPLNAHPFSAPFYLDTSRYRAVLGEVI